MSSRQEEKAKRKAEREAQEQAAAKKAAAAQRVRVAGAVAAAVAILVVAIILVAGSGGGGDDNGDSVKQTVAKGVKIPPVKITNLDEAVKAAGCVLLNPPSEGQGHTTELVKYKTNPPSSGSHHPVWAEDGIYAPGNEPTKEHTVHSLEHGRIDIQYEVGTTKLLRDQLETLGSESFNGTPGYHVLVFQNQTKMPYQVAAVAWTHILGCKTWNDKGFDAIRAFRKAYTDKGPEIVP